MSEEKFEIRDMRKRDKFFVDDFYVDAAARVVKPYATAVYVALCRHVGPDQECWPSVNRIALEMGMSPRQTARGIRTLEEKSIVRIKRLGKKMNNRYCLMDKSEWTIGQVTDMPNRQVTPALQADHPLTNRQVHSKDSQLLKDSHSKVTPDEAGEAAIAPTKGQKRTKHSSEEFNFLKDYQLRTWKLSGGEYPWGKVDAGMISRLLNSYTLATAMALLDLFWVEIRKFDNDWVLKNMGRNAKGLLHMLPRLMDNPDLKGRAEKHERAWLASRPGADMKAGDELARTLGAGLQRVPGPPNQDALRRAALDKSDQITRGAA